MHDTLEYAQKLEGTVRNTGVHACAIIIGRDNLTDHIPISIAKDKETGEDMWVSQYEGSFIEDVGMLKMDFLGLRTLSILKEAVSNVKKRHGIDIDIEAIPIDDKKTFELFGRGDTVAVFQFESPGMQKWLRELQPSRFEDLIAMNALYRPGPMDYIPDFVARKKGEQAIEYDLPQMEEILQDTYGVTVYQEQVMLLSQKLANFTKGMADGLRKAMGKKLIDKMMELKVKFMEGGEANGHPQETLEKIWKDWTAFAQYAFNKSHATCYAWVAYQTGYMKAHYPAEFMAANLTKNINNMDEITKLVGECNRMGIQVLGPDINESSGTFSVNKAGNVRYGMAGVKGVGAAAIDAIVDIRGEKPFEGIFDFAERIAPVNNIGKKIIESLAYVGAFDSFPEITRPQFFMENSRGDIFVDALMRYAQKLQTDQFDSQNSLFGGLEESVKPTPPEIPASREYNKMEFLKKEKELVGKYLSAHPLDMYTFEIENFVKQTLSQIQELEAESGSRPDLAGKELYVAAIVSKVAKKMGKDKPFMDVEFEDYSGSYSHRLFSKDYEKYMSYMQEGNILYIKFALVPPFIKNDDKQEKPKVLPCKLRIKRVALLANTKEEFVKGISVTIPVTRFNADFNKALVNALKSNKGEKTLNLHVIDYVNKMQVKFFSRKFKVDITEDFITFLQLNSLDYKVNMDLKF